MNLHKSKKHDPFYRSIVLLACAITVVLGSFLSEGTCLARTDTQVQAAVDQEVRSESVVRLRAAVEYLCSKELAGRGLQNKGLAKAAKYIEEEFESLGLITKVPDAAADQTFQSSIRGKRNNDGGKGKITERNVFAILEGTGPHAEETVIIGGHYDHLGLRTNAKDPKKKDMYPGADDNASGTAIVIETARLLVERKVSLDRTVIFVAFTGEERGLLGSKHYCDHPVRPLDKTVAMVNLDMVGKLHQGELTLSATGSGDRWNEFFAAANRTGELNLVNRSGPVGMSDHSAFMRNKIPAIHAFTGFHLDYHKPTDTPDKINYEGMATTADFMASLLLELANSKTALKFQESTSSSSGKKVAFFGISPGVSAETNSVQIAQVFKDSPANKAGLEKGDVIKKIDRQGINNLHTLFGIIQKKKPGDKIVVDILRDEKPMKFEVKLGEAVRH